MLKVVLVVVEVGDELFDVLELIHGLFVVLERVTSVNTSLVFLLARVLLHLRISFQNFLWIEEEVVHGEATPAVGLVIGAAATGH